MSSDDDDMPSLVDESCHSDSDARPPERPVAPKPATNATAPVPQPTNNADGEASEDEDVEDDDDGNDDDADGDGDDDDDNSSLPSLLSVEESSDDDVTPPSRRAKQAKSEKASASKAAASSSSRATAANAPKPAAAPPPGKEKSADAEPPPKAKGKAPAPPPPEKTPEQLEEERKREEEERERKLQEKKEKEKARKEALKKKKAEEKKRREDDEKQLRAQFLDMQLAAQKRRAQQELAERIEHAKKFDIDYNLAFVPGQSRLFEWKEGGDEGVDTCALCLEDFEEGEQCRQIMCDQTKEPPGPGHPFHQHCVDEWMVTPFREVREHIEKGTMVERRHAKKWYPQMSCPACRFILKIKASFEADIQRIIKPAPPPRARPAEEEQSAAAAGGTSGMGASNSSASSLGLSRGAAPSAAGPVRGSKLHEAHPWRCSAAYPGRRDSGRADGAPRSGSDSALGDGSGPGDRPHAGHRGGEHRCLTRGGCGGPGPHEQDQDAHGVLPPRQRHRHRRPRGVRHRPGQEPRPALAPPGGSRG